MQLELVYNQFEQKEIASSEAVLPIFFFTDNDFHLTLTVQASSKPNP